MCGLLDPKHLIYTGVKCEFIVIPLLVHCVYYDAASPELLRSTTVKTLYYSYGAGTGCCVGFTGVFNTFKESLSSLLTDRHTVFSVSLWCNFSIYIYVFCLLYY